MPTNAEAQRTSVAPEAATATVSVLGAGRAVASALMLSTTNERADS
jgi:hypothetical protein